MTLSGMLRRNWREALLAAILALPWLSLLALGMVWLWQEGHVLAWLLAASALGLSAWPLRRAIRRRSKARVTEDLAGRAGSSPEWGATAQAAWAEVTRLAEATPPLGFTEAERVPILARETVETVARAFHPDKETPWARFTLPEALLLAERVARDLRREVLSQVPGSRHARLDHLLWLQRQNERHGTLLRTAWRFGYPLYRIGRLGLNPKGAVSSELKTLIYGQAEGALSYRLRAYATRLMVLEVGRAAVDLYSGRLQLSDAELAEALAADQAEAAPPASEPIRIVLAGQVNSGKSTLVNALAQDVLSEVSAVPTASGVVEHALRVDGRPAVILADTPGIMAAKDGHAALLAQARRADLLLWVVSATQPARSADLVTLDALRADFAKAGQRPPPMLVAVTGVDRLRPSAEWAPPYDVAAGQGAKATSIRAAVQAVATALGVPAASLVPVAAPPGGEGWNHEALWAAVAGSQQAAKLRQVERLRLARGGFSVADLAGQAGRAAQRLARGIVQG